MRRLHTVQALRPGCLLYKKPLLHTIVRFASGPRENPSIKNLPSDQEAKRSDLSKWFSSKMDSLQVAMFQAGRTLNDVTGYSAIDALKQSIEQQEVKIQHWREDVQTCREAYARAIQQRSSSQREMNDLLQRKHQWTAEDVQRLTDLYKSDHENEMLVSKTEKASEQAERLLDDGQQHLTQLISSRYQEEQVWSDKIRRASTWGTWGLMGFNVVLFLLVQLGLEPWKRRRLVGSFEDKVKSALDGRMPESSRIDELETRLREVEAEKDLVQDTLPIPVWGNFGSRVMAGMETDSPVTVRPVEVLSTAGVAAAVGLGLGCLVTLAFR